MQEQIRENTKEAYALAVLNLMAKDHPSFVYTEFTVHGVQYRYFNFHDRSGTTNLRIHLPADVVDWDAAWTAVDSVEKIIREREARKAASEALSKKLDDVLTDEERKMVIVV